jgi:hypothetical protein
MTIPRTPLFYVEVDLTNLAPPADELTETIGHVAKQLHILAHHDPQHNKAFVRKTKHGYHDFGFRRYLNDEIVATLTVLTDNRVRVTYHNGRESETLYL